MAASAAPRAGLPPLPRLWEFEAPPRWHAIDFISDLHLQADHPRTFAAFAGHLRHTRADAVFILGDLFDAWIGDDARHAGFEAEVLAVLQDAAARRSLAFMAGNRDFLVGSALLQEGGLLALPDPTALLAFGERLLLSHGDALCLEDVDYQRYRAEVRGTDWQTAFLARPLAERRAIALQMRAASMRHQQRPETWADLDTACTVQWMHAAATPTLVHGHTHRPGSEALAPGYTRHVLSDWECDAPGAPRAEVLRLTRRGLERLAPATATSP